MIKLITILNEIEIDILGKWRNIPKDLYTVNVVVGREDNNYWVIANSEKEAKILAKEDREKDLDFDDNITKIYCMKIKGDKGMEEYWLEYLNDYEAEDAKFKLFLQNKIKVYCYDSGT